MHHALAVHVRSEPPNLLRRVQRPRERQRSLSRSIARSDTPPRTPLRYTSGFFRTGVYTLMMLGWSGPGWTACLLALEAAVEDDVAFELRVGIF